MWRRIILNEDRLILNYADCLWNQLSSVLRKPLFHMNPDGSTFPSERTGSSIPNTSLPNMAAMPDTASGSVSFIFDPSWFDLFYDNLEL